MNNAELEQSEEMQMEGGQAELQNAEVEANSEGMATLTGGRRRRNRSRSRGSRKSKSKSAKKSRSRSKGSKKQRKTKKGGSFKSGAVGTAAAPLLLLGMQQVMAKKLGKNKKSRKGKRGSRKH